MKRINKLTYLLMLMFLAGCAGPVAAQTKMEAIDWKVACERLKSYTPPSDNAELFALTRYLSCATSKQRNEVETYFLKLLRNPQASDDAKRFICQQGAYMKSDEAVQIMADLQADPKFSYSACYGLLQIPNEKVGTALRDALGRRSGRPLAEAMQTLGALRDGKSVAALANQLKNADRGAVCAAVTALGEIGSAEAATVLEGFEAAAAELKEPVADARLKCATALGGGREVALYNNYLKSSFQLVRVAAYVGLLKTEPAQRNTRLIEVLKGNDAGLKAVAYREARQGGGTALTKQLCDLLAALPPAEQAVLLGVLRERADVTALPQVLKCAESTDTGIRREALLAIGILGNVAQVGLLVTAAAKETGDVQICAREALTRLRGNAVDDELVKLAGNSALPERRELVGVIAIRGSKSAVPALMKLAEDADAGIRREAIRGLSRLAGLSEYGELVLRMLNTKVEDDQSGYKNAAIKVYRRDKEPEKCVDLLLKTMQTTGGQPPEAAYELLVAFGSPKALGMLTEGLKASAETRKNVLRTMVSWPNAEPVPLLIEWVRQSDDVAVRVLALRAAVAMVVRDSGLAPAEKVGKLTELRKGIDRVDEKRLILGALGEIRSAEGLALTTELMDTPELANESALVLVEVAKRSNNFPASAGKLKAALQKAAEAKISSAVQKAVQEQLKVL